MHRFFTEGSDFILGAFYCEPLQVKLQDEQQVFIAEYLHDFRSKHAIQLSSLEMMMIMQDGGYNFQSVLRKFLYDTL